MISEGTVLSCYSALYQTRTFFFSFIVRMDLFTTVAKPENWIIDMANNNSDCSGILTMSLLRDIMCVKFWFRIFNSNLLAEAKCGIIVCCWDIWYKQGNAWFKCFMLLKITSHILSMLKLQLEILVKSLWVFQGYVFIW